MHQDKKYKNNSSNYNIYMCDGISYKTIHNNLLLNLEVLCNWNMWFPEIAAALINVSLVSSCKDFY